MRLSELQKRIVVYLLEKTSPRNLRAIPRMMAKKGKRPLASDAIQYVGTYWAIARNVYGDVALRDDPAKHQAFFVKRSYYSSLCRSIRNLAEKGLVQVKHSRRSVKRRRDTALVTLTPKGELVAARVAKEKEEEFASSLQDLQLWSRFFRPAYGALKRCKETVNK